MICHTCQSDDTFLFCSLCRKAYCNEHKCVHLGDFEQSYENQYENKLDNESNPSEGGAGQYYNNPRSERRHWLSYATIISSMSDKQITDAIKRYTLLIHELNAEIDQRRIECGRIYVEASTNTYSNNFSKESSTTSKKKVCKLSKIVKQIMSLNIDKQREILNLLIGEKHVR